MNHAGVRMALLTQFPGTCPESSKRGMKVDTAACPGGGGGRGDREGIWRFNSCCLASFWPLLSLVSWKSVPPPSKPKSLSIPPSPLHLLLPGGPSLLLTQVLPSLLELLAARWCRLFLFERRFAVSLGLLLLNPFSDIPGLSRKDVKPLHHPTPTFVPASALSPPANSLLSGASTHQAVCRTPNTSPSLPLCSRHAGRLAQKALLCSSRYLESLCRCPLPWEGSPASPTRPPGLGK